MQISPDESEERKTAEWFLKVTVPRHPSRQTPRPQKPTWNLFLMRIFCLFVFVEPEGDLCRCSQFLSTFWTQYSSISVLALILLLVSNRAVENPEERWAVPALIKPPPRKTGAENKSNRSRPVEQGDTVRVDVTSCFIVWVCVQPNRDWTWKKARSKTGLLFFFPGESQEICCTFQATQSRTDERGREHGAAQTGVKLIFRQNKTELWISEQWKTRQRRGEQCSSHSHYMLMRFTVPLTL